MRRGPAKQPRFHRHFVPTSLSWLSLVERGLRELTQECIRRGVFGSVPVLMTALHEYLKANNAGPKPFAGQASGEDILQKVPRGKAALQTRHERRRPSRLARFQLSSDHANPIKTVRERGIERVLLWWDAHAVQQHRSSPPEAPFRRTQPSLTPAQSVDRVD